MRRLIKTLFYLALFAVAGLLGYSYFGDMDPDQTPVRTAIEVPELDAPQ